MTCIIAATPLPVLIGRSTQQPGHVSTDGECSNRFGYCRMMRVSSEPAPVIEVFTDQAFNLILLAKDEARMLGQPTVSPEHLLLALARRGNVESLLARRDLAASDVHAAIVRAGGLGRELVLGRVPRSAATDAALGRAIAAAAERGVLGPSSEHVLLGLNDDQTASAILRDVGVEDVMALVNEVYPPRRRPVPAEQVRTYAARQAIVREPPQPGPIAPVFERFTVQAHAAVLAADRSAEDVYIEPLHLLLGLLEVPDGVAAKALAANDVTLARIRRTDGRRPDRPVSPRVLPRSTLRTSSSASPQIQRAGYSPRSHYDAPTRAATRQSEPDTSCSASSTLMTPRCRRPSEDQTPLSGFARP